MKLTALVAIGVAAGILVVWYLKRVQPPIPSGQPFYWVDAKTGFSGVVYIDIRDDTWSTHSSGVFVA